MTKRLLVGYSRGGSFSCADRLRRRIARSRHRQSTDTAPVELEVASPANSETSAAYNELLDPEFGCNGGGSLEYGLVDRPDLD